MNMIIYKNCSWIVFIALLTLPVTISLTSCDLSVEAFDLIEDADLDKIEAIPALVAGAAGDYVFATINPGGGGLFNASALLSDEMVHVGTFEALRGLSNGFSRDDWVEVQGWWSSASRARWVAENGIIRIKELVDNPDNNPYLARMMMFAGHANRLMGDNFGHAVIDGGPLQHRRVFYERAETYFTDAIEVATNANRPDIARSALGGRAHVRMNLGDWEGAVSDASEIPTEFVYEAIYSSNSSREYNQYYWWAHDRPENGIWGTPFAEWGLQVDAGGSPVEGATGDPRVPYEITGDLGGDGTRPFWRQKKFTSRDDNIPMVKGTEMRLVEAEAALVLHQDVESAIGKINEVREYYNNSRGYNLPLVSANTLDEAWELLMKERGIELWLEGKRLGDLRRWKEAGRPVPFLVVRQDDNNPEPVLENVLELYLQVSRNERNSNPNIN